LQVVPATSESSGGNAAARASVYNILKGIIQSEPNFASVRQNLSFCDILIKDFKQELNAVDAAQNLTACKVDGNSKAALIPVQCRCRFLWDIIVQIFIYLFRSKCGW
jgi:hypothetical protein